MPNVRRVPKRRRTDCPICNKNVSYTIPYNPDVLQQLNDDREGYAILKVHNRLDLPSEKCSTGGVIKRYEHLDRTINGSQESI